MSDNRKRAQKTRPRRARRILAGALFGFLLVIVAALATLTGFYFGLMRGLPSLDLATVAAKSAQTTRIYDNSEDPVLLAELHGVENREILETEEIPQVMRDALVAIEDERFYSHHGVDFLGILRAVWANVRNREIVQGGSTITQQYIKNALVNDDKTLDRKLREALLAYQLEKTWSKDKILTEYLNIIYFGEGAYGLEAAAQEYFGVHARELTLDQAALLAGLPKAPSTYSPRRNPEAALARRNLVLNKMYQQHFITAAELQAALAKPLELAEKGQDDGTAVPYWVELVREQLTSRYGSSTVLEGGLRVYTSVDLDLQEKAEEAIANILDQENDPAAALVCIDVRTGHLVAMVGGKDFSLSQFNLATDGRRQPGSAFKPFVLATALDQGMSPDALYASGPAHIELPSGTWDVSSTDEGLITLRQATAKSSNGVYARLIMDVGASAVAETAYEMGIQTSLGTEPNPAIALGGLSTGVSPLEMAMAYATLATGGNRLDESVPFASDSTASPVVIVRVTDADGNVLDENEVVSTRALDKDVAAIVTSCLEAVITDGTGTAAAIDRPAAGKTGTTSNYRDAWFVGYTPELVTAVWVGYPDEQKAMTNVHGIKVTGGSFPAQIWAAFMKQAVQDITPSEFSLPSAEKWVTVKVCSESHQLPTSLCPETVNALFRVDKVPTEQCHIHQPKKIAVPDVVGLSREEAEKMLAAAGFTSTVTEYPEASQPAGIVADQSPEGGESALQGTTISLVVSARPAAPSTVSVPKVVGLEIANARAILAAVNLETSENSVPDEHAAGTVLAQEPAAGTSVAPGTVITLTVSSGPPPPET